MGRSGSAGGRAGLERLAVEAKFKLSQNRSAEDHARVVQALIARAGPDDLAVARLMSQR